MFTVTLFIQAALPVSSCCEVSSSERTLQLCSYQMQHSSLAHSKGISLQHTKATAVRQSNLFLLQLIKPSLLLQPACNLTYLHVIKIL